MACKRFYVKIDLQLHAITCPGVWLCVHGTLEATIETLGYILRTDVLKPKFPLICDDYFTMEGYFESVTSIHNLKEAVVSEALHIFLWQNGCVLAYFTGTLNNVLPPAEADTSKYNCGRNRNTQLQMLATAAFPGIIAPKVELSAEVFIKDRFSRGGTGQSGVVLQLVSRDAIKSYRSEKNYDICLPMSVANTYKPRKCSQRKRQKTVCHAKNQKEIAKERSMDNKSTSTPNYYSNNETIAYKSSLTTANELNHSSCYCDHCAAINLQVTEQNSPVQHVRDCSICQLYQNEFF